MVVSLMSVCLKDGSPTMPISSFLTCRVRKAETWFVRLVGLGQVRLAINADLANRH